MMPYSQAMSLFKFFKSRGAAQTDTPADTAPQAPAPAPPAPKPAASSVPQVGIRMNVSYGSTQMNWGMPMPAAAPTPQQPPTPAQLFEQAQALHKQGQLQSALPLYQQLLQQEPQHAHALHYLGLLLVQAGQTEAGIQHIRQSLAVDPQQFAAWGNLAGALQELKQLPAAIEALQQALALKPDSAALWNNQGNLLLECQRHEEAAHSYRQALALQADLSSAANHLGIALCALNRYEDALAAADQALRYAPSLADAHDTRGNALRHLGRREEALAAYAQAIALAPQQLSYLANRCSVLEDLDHYEAALADLRDIQRRDPQFKCIKGRLLHAQRRCLDWAGIRELTQSVVDQTLAGRISDSPLNMLAVSDDPAVQLACAQQALADAATVKRAALPRRARQNGDKIRIAYVSGDLREHAVSYLMAGVFEAHDRQRFEITAISLKPAEHSPMGQRVQAAFDSFLDVSQWRDDQIVEHMRQHGYDIAIDLMGLTFGARPGIWAQGIAPIQVNYLGYPGTTGAPYMDVILADEFVIPPDLQKHYSEQVVYLPDCYQANDRQRPLPANKPARSTLGLPDDAFVYCAFNNLYKISPEQFDSWARILHAVPGSVLWLVDDQDVARRHAQQEIHARGVDPARLIFAARVPYAEHLARLQQADLFLDTLPFNAGTTASDALWSGLPLITRPGQAFASRMAGSLLRAAGLPELICETEADYEALAIELAHHPARLQALRARLQSQRMDCVLFDTERFTRQLELTYERLLVSG